MNGKSSSTMDWEGILKWIKRGETDEDDAKFLLILRKALDALTKSYSSNYYTPLAKVLRVHKQMSHWAPLGDDPC